jgi:hypothetical protein
MKIIIEHTEDEKAIASHLQRYLLGVFDPVEYGIGLNNIQLKQTDPPGAQADGFPEYKNED